VIATAALSLSKGVSRTGALRQAHGYGEGSAAAFAFARPH